MSSTPTTFNNSCSEVNSFFSTSTKFLVYVFWLRSMSGVISEEGRFGKNFQTCWGETASTQQPKKNRQAWMLLIIQQGSLPPGPQKERIVFLSHYFLGVNYFKLWGHDMYMYIYIYLIYMYIYIYIHKYTHGAHLILGINPDANVKKARRSSWQRTK